MFADYQLHHVGVVLTTMDEAAAHMQIFELEEDYRGFVEPWQCWCIFTKPRLGQPAIELVVPEGGALESFNKGMGGVHHYAFEIDDFGKAEKWCEAKDLRLVEPEPIKGAGDFLCNFIHPLGTRGIQIELVLPFNKA